MKILVLGGSYFYGRVFVMQASSEHTITVVNRGTYSMKDFGVSQLIGDRKDINLWKNCTEDYDVIVDFCGYNKGDIKIVLDNISGRVQQYIFISTVDVYERGHKILMDEKGPLEKRSIPGEAGNYIIGKIELEKELIFECVKRKISYTILRPAILYGPYNYAPREALYIQMLVQNHILPYIKDATGKFQFVYIKDAADIIIKCLLNTNSFNQIYNVCDDMILDYHMFVNQLKEIADVEYEIIPMTKEQALSQNVPLPFPLTMEESELYSNIKSKVELNVCYTKFSEGLLKTYNAFKKVYM